MPRLASDAKPQFKRVQNKQHSGDNADYPVARIPGQPSSVMNTRYSNKMQGENIRSQELKPSFKRSVMSPDAVPMG